MVQTQPHYKRLCHIQPRSQGLSSSCPLEPSWESSRVFSCLAQSVDSQCRELKKILVNSHPHLTRALQPMKLEYIIDWQVAALITPSRHPLKSVVDSRVNNGTPTRLRHSDLSTKILFKRKQKSKRRSVPVHNLRQLIPTLVKTLTPSPIHEECLKKDEESICDLPPSKDKSDEDFMAKAGVKEVEKVWIRHCYLKYYWF